MDNLTKGQTLSEFIEEAFANGFRDMDKDHMETLIQAMWQRQKYHEWRHMVLETFLVGAVDLERLKYWRKTLVEIKEQHHVWKGYIDESELK